MWFPEHLCSFYLGTGRPPQYQQQVAQKFIEADTHHADTIMLPRLIHGVCYSMPPAHIPVVLKSWKKNNAANYAIAMNRVELEW